MEKLLERLEAAVSRLESFHSAVPRPPSLSPDPLQQQEVLDPAIAAFDDLIEKSLGKVLAAAHKIGGQVLETTKILEEAFMVQRTLLIKAKQCRGEFLKPLNEVIVKANALTEGRRSDFFNHLKTIADSLSALVWIAYSGKDCGLSLPTAHVEESWQMAEFYNNKVLVEYRDKDADHVEWAKSLPVLRNYVKSFYPLGPVWSLTGNLAATVTIMPSKTQPKAPSPPAVGSLSRADVSSSTRPTEGMSAIFKEISSGQAVTTGLRKVTDDMKTKNRADRTGVVSGVGKEPGHSSGAPFSKTGPPKLELQMGRKWVVENQIGKKNLLIDDCDAKQSIYVFGCKDSVLQVKGKVNNITIDKCIKTGVVFMDVVAACEIVNCGSVGVQCQGMAPTIAVDNTAGCQLYLSKDSLGTSITTAKSSEINVLVPHVGTDKDWVPQFPENYSVRKKLIHLLDVDQNVTLSWNDDQAKNIILANRFAV